MAKKGFLGCSFSLVISVVVVFLVLFVISFLAGPLGSQIVEAFGKMVNPDYTLPGWIVSLQAIAVSKPSPELPAEAVFHIGSFPITNTVIAAWLSMIVVLLLAWAATRKMRIIPKGIQNFVEFAIGSLYNLCTGMAGEKNGRRFFPIVATIFLFVIMNGWLSLLPVFNAILVHTTEGEVHLLRGANTDVNMPLALALVSFVSVWYFGFKDIGFRKYMGQFFAFRRFFSSMGMIFKGNLKGGLGGMFFGVIDIFVGALELLSQFVRVISFTFRLFGNMTAGEILLIITTFLVPWIAVLPFYGLELFFMFIQALIFSSLTLVFLTMAVAHHEEENTHK